MIKATAPDEVRDSRLLIIPFAMAALFCLMALLQMVNFQAFVMSIAQYSNMTFAGRVSVSLIILVTEIFALPFLLRLWLSALARYVSALFVLLVPLIWAVLLIPAWLQKINLSNTGMLGDLIHIHLGLTAILIELVLLVGAGVSFYALGGLKVVHFR